MGPTGLLFRILSFFSVIWRLNDHTRSMCPFLKKWCESDGYRMEKRVQESVGCLFGAIQLEFTQLCIFFNFPSPTGVTQICANTGVPVTAVCLLCYVIII